MLVDFTTGLSGRLFAFTVGFVLIAEILVFIPSLCTYHYRWLDDRISAAQIAALVYEANRGQGFESTLEENVLERTGVLVLVLKRGGAVEPLFMVKDPPPADMVIDLATIGMWGLLDSTFRSFVSPPGRNIYVMGAPLPTGEAIEILISEAPLKAAMWGFAGRILFVSLIIAAITAALVYAAVFFEFVRPIRQIIFSMLHFRDKPEDASRIIEPGAGRGELADARKALSDMQTELHSALQQKSRLAALGTAVSKINHDLRNILASGQLMTDRLAAIDDPTVRRLAPKLVKSIDRAVTLCTQTLKYGKAEEPKPDKQWITLKTICTDVQSSLDLPADGRITFVCQTPERYQVYADADQLFRIMLNLARNAIQAIEAGGAPGKTHSVTVSTGITGQGETRMSVIDLEDTGPGIPETVRERLFQAFVSSARAGGSGLGLAISHELARAHGGDLTLERSDESGTVFRIALPCPPGSDERDAAQGGRGRTASKQARKTRSKRRPARKKG